MEYVKRLVELVEVVAVAVAPVALLIIRLGGGL